MTFKVRLLGFTAGLMIAATSGLALAAAGDPLAATHLGAWGIDLSGQDHSVTPGQDFYRYAEGGYTDKLTIPADRASVGTFDTLEDLSEARLRSIIEKAAADPVTSPEAAQIGNFYSSFMDERHIEAADDKPLRADLATIKEADTKDKIATLMGRGSSSFYSGFFSANIDGDRKDVGREVVYLSQAGLGLPSRDYYLEASFSKQKQAYRDYVETVLKSIGWADPAANADAILAMESKIAEVSWTQVQQRDDIAEYNPMTPAALEKFAPGFPWKQYSTAAGLADQNLLVVGELTAFPKIATIFKDTPVETLQAWEAFSVAGSASPYLSKRFVDQRFNFVKLLSGQEEQRPRWKRAVATVDGSLGESIGKLYVADYFTPQAKAEMIQLVSNLKTALQARIERLTWMSPQTKKEALIKLAAMKVKVGYPDKWRDYSKLVIRKDDLFGNVERSQAFEWQYQLDKLMKPVDKTLWDMTPQTVNAYYNQVNNEVVFPAAILVAPFFDAKADPAVNYGAIGSIIGHEITHAFDDEGRHSDETGKLRDWWTADDATHFDVQAKKLSAQYSAFEPLPGVHINGDQTLGENIADMGGVLISLDAYHLSLGGKPSPVLDGYTGDQRFFLAFAQNYRGKTRDDAVRDAIVSDVHSPDHFRAIGAVRNSDAFYEAFNVKPGDKMYVAPEDRVRIW